MSDIKFYNHKKVNEVVTAIRSMTGEIMFLIEGDNHAILIDTCLGVGHLKAYVETLTKKPLTVLLSHGHIDHALGAPEFDDVYMNHKDTDIYLAMSDLEGRKGYIKGNLGGVLPAFDEEDYVQPAPMTFKDLKEGDVFDLGGVTVEVYAMPGHTPGSMVFLIPEEHTLILGDACNKSTFLFDENSSTVGEYKQQVLRIMELLNGKYDRIYCCHHDMEFPIELLPDMVRVCDDILAGNTDDVPFPFMGRTDAFIAKAVGEQMNRIDGGIANLIYNKNRRL